LEGMRTIGYYQWVPYILLAMAASFYVPHAIWLNMRTKTDVDFESAVKQSGVVRESHEPNKRGSELRKLAAYLCHVNRLRQNRDMWGKGLGSTGSYIYVASKMLNLVNVAAQFFLVVSFVGQGQVLWGFRLVRDALNGVYWDRNGFFPRVAYCRFDQLSSQAGNQSRLGQCALMINMINEKIFFFIYFWFLLLFLVTLIDVCWSVAHFLLGVGQVKFGKRYLKMMDRLNSGELRTEREVRQFIHESLGMDGLLLFHFIDDFVGSMVAGEIACEYYVKMLTDPEGMLDDEDFKDNRKDGDGLKQIEQVTEKGVELEVE